MVISLFLFLAFAFSWMWPQLGHEGEGAPEGAETVLLCRTLPFFGGLLPYAPVVFVCDTEVSFVSRILRLDHFYLYGDYISFVKR